jgi:CRISPR-associated endonuclease/helicase Cas3
VYPDHALLWKTAVTLFVARCGQVSVPGDVRSVVEAVYGDGALDDVPPALTHLANDADGNRQAARAHAWANLLTVGRGYDGEHHGWQHDVKTPTRLGEEQITLRLAKTAGDAVVPWCADPDTRRAWALSEVSVRRAKVDGVPKPESRDVRAAVERAVAAWPDWEREAVPVLVLEEAADLYADADATSDGGGPTLGAELARVERRRDVAVNRRRWQFGLRDELVARALASTPSGSG